MSMFDPVAAPPAPVAPPTSNPIDDARKASIAAAQALALRPRRDRSSLVIDPATPTPAGVGINTGQ